MSDVADRLLPDIADVLKCDNNDALRAEVMQCVETARAAAQHWRRFDPPAVRKAARNLVKALAAMDAVYGAAAFELSGMPEEIRSKLVSEYGVMRMQVEPLQKFNGPDPRFDVLHWECAEQADKLIKKSGRKPVQTLGGNAHRITKYLVEIATDGAEHAPLDDDAWLLKVARKVHRLRNSA
jgi:hypothetical protein